MRLSSFARLSSLVALALMGCSGSISEPTGPGTAGNGDTGAHTGGGPTHLRASVSDTTFLSIGDTVTASAVVTDAAGTPVTASVLWSISAPSVVALGTTPGTVVSLMPGTSLLIASYAGLADTLHLVVAPRAVRMLIPAPMTTLSAIGATVLLPVTVTDARGVPVSGASVSFNSGNTAVATVSPAGLVTATGAGMTMIRIQAAPTLIDSARVTVVPPDITVGSVTLATHSYSSNAIGDTLRLVATASTKGGSVVSTTIVYRSLDPSVVMVGPTGFAWTAGAGTGRLVASVGTFADTATVTVTQVATSMRMSVATASLTAVGQTATLTATPLDRLGSPIAGSVIAWTSSAPAVATVGTTGLLTAVANGSTTITAKFGTVSGTAAVTVAIAPSTPAALAFALRTGAMTSLNDTLRLRAVVRDAAGAVMTTVPTYRVLETLYATVDAGGLVTEHGTGTAHVVASLGALADTATLTLSQVATRITVSRTVDSLVVGDSVSPGFNAYDARGNYIALYPTLTSAAPGTARVSGTRVVGVTPGSTTVTATLNGATAQSSLVVRAAAPVISVSALRTPTPGGSTTVVGRGFLAATALSIDGVAVPLPGARSDSLMTVTMPTTQSCDVDGRPIGVKVTAGTVTATGTYPLIVPSSWTLGIGESRTVSPAQAACLVLPKGSANYRLSVVSLDRGNAASAAFTFQTIVSHAASYSLSPSLSALASRMAQPVRSTRVLPTVSDLVSPAVHPAARMGLSTTTPVTYRQAVSPTGLSPSRASRSVSGTTSTTFDPRLATAVVGDTIVLPDWFNKTTTQYDMCAMPHDSVPVLKAIVYAINGNAVALLDTRMTNIPSYMDPAVRARFTTALGVAEQTSLPAIHSVIDPAYSTAPGAGGRYFAIVTAIPIKADGTIWFAEGMPKSACPNASGIDVAVLTFSALNMSVNTLSATIDHERGHIADQRYAWKTGVATTSYGRQLTSSGWYVEALASTVQEMASRMNMGKYFSAVDQSSPTAPETQWGIWPDPKHDLISPWGATTTNTSIFGEYDLGSQYLTFARQIMGEGTSSTPPAQTLFQRLAVGGAWGIDAVAAAAGMTGDNLLDQATLAIVTDDAVSAAAAARYNLPQFTYWDNSRTQAAADNSVQFFQPTHFWSSTAAQSGTETLAPGSFTFFVALTDADKGQSIKLTPVAGAPGNIIRLTRIR